MNFEDHVTCLSIAEIISIPVHLNLCISHKAQITFSFLIFNFYHTLMVILYGVSAQSTVK